MANDEVKPLLFMKFFLLNWHKSSVGLNPSDVTIKPDFDVTRI